MAGALKLGRELVGTTALNVLGPVAPAGLLALDGIAVGATVGLVGLAVAAEVKGAAVFVADGVRPFWMGGKGVRVVGGKSKERKEK